MNRLGFLKRLAALPLAFKAAKEVIAEPKDTFMWTFPEKEEPTTSLTKKIKPIDYSGVGRSGYYCITGRCEYSAASGYFNPTWFTGSRF